MANERQTTPTNSANITAACLVAFVVLTLGVLLVLAGTGVIPVELARFWWPAVCVMLWLSGTINGVLRKESWSVWTAGIFLGLAIAYIINWATEIGYDKLYPIFIAIPALCSLLTLPITKNKNMHLKSIILFGGIATIFLIQVFANLHILVAVGIAVIIAGLFMFINVITYKRGRWDDGDRPQRRRT